MNGAEPSWRYAFVSGSPPWTYEREYGEKKHVKLVRLTSFSSYALCRCGWDKKKLSDRNLKRSRRKMNIIFLVFPFSVDLNFPIQVIQEVKFEVKNCFFKFMQNNLKKSQLLLGE